MKQFFVDLKTVLPIFIIWRVWLLVIGYWSIGLLSFKASFPFIDETLIASGLPQWLWQWGNFDGVHYLFIAKIGYAFNGMQAFFPLYPVLIKLLHLIFQNYVFSALIISNLSFLVALVLVRRLYGCWAVFFTMLFPTSFYFVSIYSESLLLLLILLFMTLGAKWRWVFSILAGTTKLIGGFMGAGVVGVWGYMVYLYWQFHNPVMFLFSQGSFKNQRANDLAGLVTPFQTVFRYIKILVTADPGNIAYWVAVLELAAFVFAVGVLGYLSINRRLPFWWFIFSWAVVILPAVTGTLTSMPRYVVVLTPIFVFLSQIENSKLKTLILGLFAVLQVVLTVLFLRGYWIA